MDEFLALGWGTWLFCACAVFVGTMIQRLAGQGFGMTASPMLALVAPEFLPGTILLLGLVVGFGSVFVDLRAVSKHELPPGFLGRALGAVIAAWIALRLADPGLFAAMIACMVYLGIALSLLGVRVAIRPVSLFLASVTGGIMGTLTGVGAPPMALLYQHEEAQRSATMQNVFFAWGMVVSILSLVVAGLISTRHLVFAASLLPLVLLGLRAAHPLGQRFAKAQIRPYALVLAGIAATILLIKQLL